MNRQTTLWIPGLLLVTLHVAGWAIAGPAGPADQAFVLSEQLVPYGVAERLWDGNQGSQRAIVRVTSPTAATRVHLPWRLQLQGMEGRQIVMTDADGRQLVNVVRIAADRMSADLVFEALAVGDYYVYYLPMRPPGNMNDPSGYLPYTCHANPGWLDANRLGAESLQAGGWRKLPEARVVGFQARSALDRLDPMEVIASEDERKSMLARNPQAMLLFPETRQHTIRMQRDLPLRWAESGPSATLLDDVRQHEYYAFQIGLYAPSQPLSNVTAKFSGLLSREGGEIPSSALTCFNLGGTNAYGRLFTKQVNVPQGSIQSLWIGVDVAEDQKPGLYRGTVVLQADGVAPQSVSLGLNVVPGVIAERGDNEPWRHSRLRWLNSVAGTGDVIPDPYLPLHVSDDRNISCLGRTLTLGNDGLPSAIAAGSSQVLAGPARFVIDGGSLTTGTLAWGSKQDSRVTWVAHSSGAAGSLECNGEMEFDGHLKYKLIFTPAADATLKDMRLELPYRAESATYLLGAGNDGGLRPGEFRWDWGGPFNGFWLGSVEAGLHCKLLGGAYTGPMLALYQPAPPDAWFNHGKGGVSIAGENGVVLATAYSGERKVKSGQPVVFEFSLLITPVKPVDQKTHFATRYYHGSGILTPDGFEARPSAAALAAGVSVVNVHHATRYNPYINYPYIRTRELADFASEMHRQNVKVKIYNTVRELTSMTTELWALRSLGNEVIADGGGGGGSWCQEHLITGYVPQWFQRFGDAPPDAAVLVNGSTDSRWLNYYVEGIGWLIRNTGIDGLYLDDVSYDRHTLQRVRAMMAQNKKGCMIDLHSNTGFSKGCSNHYMEFFPYIDRPWFGESFNYNAMSADQYLVQVSGIPFGLMGEMLHLGGNLWRGAVFGMTNRLDWLTGDVRCDPRPVWKIWDRFGLAEARMIGYWDSGCPVKTDNPAIKATAYVKSGRTMIALASWAPAEAETKLSIDWKSLGLDPAKAVLDAPASEGFQPEMKWKPTDPIRVAPNRGWLIIVDEH